MEISNILIGRLITISTANVEIIMKVIQISISTFVNSLGNKGEIIHLDNFNDDHTTLGSTPRKTKTMGKNENCNFFLFINYDINFYLTLVSPLVEKILLVLLEVSSEPKRQIIIHGY